MLKSYQQGLPLWWPVIRVQFASIHCANSQHGIEEMVSFARVQLSQLLHFIAGCSKAASEVIPFGEGVEEGDVNGGLVIETSGRRYIVVDV